MVNPFGDFFSNPPDGPDIGAYVWGYLDGPWGKTGPTTNKQQLAGWLNGFARACKTTREAEYEAPKAEEGA